MAIIQHTDHLHAADEPELVTAPAASYVSIRGAGAPGTDEFYRKKRVIAHVASALMKDGTEPAIELQYWYPDGSEQVGIADFYSVNPVSSLQYRVMAAVPSDTSSNEFTEAASSETNTEKKDSDDIELYATTEHTAVQVMHHGPFAEEFGTLEWLEAFARTKGVHRSGPHLEIHLDAFERETDQRALRTILRDPVE